MSWFTIRRKPALNKTQGYSCSKNVPSISAPIPGADGKLPEWIEILQAGKITDTVDGRQYENHDPVALTALLNGRAAKGIDLHMDAHHQSTDSENKKGVVGALAWMDKFENRNGAIFAHVKEYTQDVPEVNSIGGLTAFTKKLLRYISPVVWHDGNGRIFDIESIAGTNTPNMYLRAVAGRQGASIMDPNQLMQELITLLGLSGDATAEQILEAVKAWGATTEDSEAAANVLAGAIGTNAKDLPALLKAAHARISADSAKVNQGADLAKKVEKLEKDLNDRAVAEKKSRIDALMDKHAAKIKPALEAQARKLAEADPVAFDELYADANDILPGADPIAGRKFTPGKAPSVEEQTTDEHLAKVSSMARQHIADQKKLGMNTALPAAVKWANAEIAKQAQGAKK